MFILLILASCTTQRIATSTKPMIQISDRDTILNNKHQVEVRYKGIYNQNFNFEVFIRNNSKEPIYANPASFKYRVISDNIKTDSKFIHAIDPALRVEHLNVQVDSLKNDKNPYSFTGESVKEVATGGIVSGIVGLLFGQSGDDLETQRKIDDDSWERDHSLRLNSVNEELDFWNNDALLPSEILPKNEVSGKVLFPFSLYTNEINIEITIQNDTYNFRFKQLD